MTTRAILLAAIALVFGAPVFATELSLDLRQDTARLALTAPLVRDARNSGTTADIGVLLSEDGNADALLAHAGILVYGDAGAPKANVEAGLGVRLVGLDADPDTTGSALTVGGRLAARVPDFNRIGFHIAGFYAPGIASFGELDEYLEYTIALDYQVIQRAFIFVGYRQIKLDVGPGGLGNLDTGFHGGIRMAF